MAAQEPADAEERDRSLHKEAGVVSPGTVEWLLEKFFTAAVGLRLLSPCNDDVDQRRRLVGADPVPAGCEPPVWAAWMTDVGRVCARGCYDRRQSQELKAHVLLIEWWLPANVHHVDWWRCDPKHPREWTAGRGS